MVPTFGVAAAANLPNLLPVPRVLCPLLCLALALSAKAQTAAPSLQGLVSNSPFGVPAASGSPAATTPLEFRGTFVDGGERFFSILDPSTKRSEWVGLNEPGRPFTVKAYDEEREAVTVDYQGRPLELKLHAARITAAPAAPAVVPGVPQAAQVLPTTNEAQRLAQVAEEIRRRRALRQQAQQAQQPQQQPPAAAPRN